jgi:hypothetical protein
MDGARKSNLQVYPCQMAVMDVDWAKMYFQLRGALGIDAHLLQGYTEQLG